MNPDKILSPGTEVLVQAPLVVAPRFFCCVRGFHPEHYIILDNQKKDGTARPLEPGMHCTIRLLRQAQVFGFKTKVLFRTSLPAPLVFMAYPQEMESLAMLQGKPRQVLFDAVFAPHKLHGQTQGGCSGLILNLTENGCLVESEEPAELNSLLYLSFGLPENESIEDLPVEIKACQTLAGHHHVLFSFLNAEPTLLEKIKTYLQALDELNIQNALQRTSCLEPGQAPAEEDKTLPANAKKE